MEKTQHKKILLFQQASHLPSPSTINVAAITAAPAALTPSSPRAKAPFFAPLPTLGYPAREREREGENDLCKVGRH